MSGLPLVSAVFGIKLRRAARVWEHRESSSRGEWWLTQAAWGGSRPVYIDVNTYFIFALSEKLRQLWSVRR